MDIRTYKKGFCRTITALLVSFGASVAFADSSTLGAVDQQAENDFVGPSLDYSVKSENNMRPVKIGKTYVMGINRFDLDGHTEILGWQLSNSVYFGRQDGLDSGLTLVWQQKANQVSLSKDGLRLTRRF